MEEIKEPSRVEDRARGYIQKKHLKVKHILFRKVQKEGDIWLIEGEVSFKRLFFTAKRSFRLEVRSETGEVASYEESII